MRFIALFLSVLFLLGPDMNAEAKKVHVMSAANQGLDISRPVYNEIRSSFFKALKADSLPAGWKRVHGGAIRHLISGKSVRSHYLNNREKFDYAFFPNGSAKRRRISDGSNQVQKWRVTNDNLLAFNLRFRVYTNGKYVVLTRRWRNKTYGEVFLKGRKITYGLYESFR